MADYKTLGQVAFEAYRDQLDGSRPWSDVREAERQVWEATAAAVRAAVAKASFGAQNARRTERAAERDVAVAARVLADHSVDWPASWLAVAWARKQYPDASWSQLAAGMGITKDAAVGIFRRVRMASAGRPAVVEGEAR